MSSPFIGETRLFPFARGAPSGWQLCDGSLLSIQQYDALYTLIGTTYGGDGSSTFAAPDLRGRVPIHQGQGTGLASYPLGQMAGIENETLTLQQMASHFHMTLASTVAGTAAAPTNGVPATVAGEPFYMPVSSATSPYALPNTTIGLTGSGAAHDNTAPTLTLNYCIALEGVYPSQQ